MTETELNKGIGELEENDLWEEHQRRKARHRLRRTADVVKNERLLGIIQLGRYAPHRGYIDWDFVGRTLLHSGKYIKYPKNSKSQRRFKRATSRCARRCASFPTKGNHYRRLFDYWWALY